jgi:hypothetical protein
LAHLLGEGYKIVRVGKYGVSSFKKYICLEEFGKLLFFPKTL